MISIGNSAGALEESPIEPVRPSVAKNHLLGK